MGASTRPARRAIAAAACAAAVTLTAACGSDPSLSDLPSGIAAARPAITVEEARFVLAAQKLGAAITPETLSDDIETGTTTCWALKNGGLELGQVAVDENDKPLGNSGLALRTKQLMAAGVQAFCDDYASQIPQLTLP